LPKANPVATNFPVPLAVSFILSNSCPVADSLSETGRSLSSIHPNLLLIGSTTPLVKIEEFQL